MVIWKEFERKRSWPTRDTNPNLSRGNMENHKSLQPGEPLYRPGFEPNTSRIVVNNTFGLVAVEQNIEKQTDCLRVSNFGVKPLMN